MTLNKNNAVQKWFRIFSPCFMATLLSLGGVILCILYLRKSEGWSALGIPVFLITSVVCFVGDRILKFIIKTTIKLWIVQLIALSVAGFLLYIFKYN